MALGLQMLYLQIRCSIKAGGIIFKEQGLLSTGPLQVLTDNNINVICNVTRKLGNKNANATCNREHQVAVMSGENFKLTAFLIYRGYTSTTEKS